STKRSPKHEPSHRLTPLTSRPSSVSAMNAHDASQGTSTRAVDALPVGSLGAGSAREAPAGSSGAVQKLDPARCELVANPIGTSEVFLGTGFGALGDLRFDLGALDAQRSRFAVAYALQKLVRRLAADAQRARHGLERVLGGVHRALGHAPLLALRAIAELID